MRKECSVEHLFLHMISASHRARAVAPPALLLMVVVVAGCPNPGAQEPIRVVVRDDTGTERLDTPEDVVELARREGELNWYTSLPEEPANRFLALFTEQHPYITTRLVRGSTFDTVQGVQSEIEGGRVRADVVHVLDVAAFITLRRQGHLLRYTHSHERFIPARYKEPGFWWALRCVDICLAYDAAHVDPEEAPQTWVDLLSPRWVGRIAMKDAQTAGSAYAHYYFLREEYGISYWRLMAAQRPQIYKTSDECLDAIRSGVADVVAGAMGYSLHDDQQPSSTVRGVWPSDGVPMMLGPIAILRGAPHRNVARLFIEFALSREGQVALRDLLGAYSPREDVGPPRGCPDLASLSVMTPMGGWEQYAQRQETLRPEYTRVFHPGSE